MASGLSMAGYYAGPQVHIIDELALGDPLLARLHPSDLSEWNIAHFRRDLPPGYFESLESGENKLLDPALAEYYDQLLLITRGDLWSRARWQAIWKMNTGQYQHLLDAYTTSAQKQNGE